MNRHLVHMTRPETETPEPSPWEEALAESDFELLRTQSVDQALSYARFYPLVGLLIDVEENGDEVKVCLDALGALEPAIQFPVIGVVGESSSREAWAAAADSGLDAIITENIPPEFLIHHLKVCQSLQELKHFEQTRNDAKSLAGETRKLLHEMSQPLSALQGKLQIRLAKCGDEDPEKAIYEPLVELTLETSRVLRKIHELQQEYS